ncbi:MAG: hypothetical protein ACRC5T_10005 [Cetobacterium sp.]
MFRIKEEFKSGATVVEVANKYGIKHYILRKRLKDDVSVYKKALYEKSNIFLKRKREILDAVWGGI